MPKQNLIRFVCDHCEAEVIAPETPRGWVRILSAEGATKPGMRHHDSPPYIWTPKDSIQLPKDAYWCSVDCLVAQVRDTAERVLDRARR